ncbi:MAG: hypothetical protein IT256_07015 [Chitinophagaceae bacterium]|nr:hypothetical protein [Chitinophagaceae bacterium]
MGKKISTLIFVFWASCIAITNAQNTTVQAKADAVQIAIGDQLRYFITASTSPTTKLSWAVLPDTFNKLELIEKGKIDTLATADGISYKQRLLITAWDSGSYLIPRFAFFVQQPGGIVDTFFTDSLRISVGAPAVDTSKPFKAIKDIATVSTSWTNNLPIIIGLLIGIGLLVWAIIYFRNNKKRAMLRTAPVYQETLHQRTIRLLHELDAQELWQQDKVKDYYTQLSILVRQYIEQRFKTPAMELTTDELLRKAKKHREMTAYRHALKPLLASADLAKFAKATPMPEEHVEAMKLAIDFVSITKPKPQPATTTNATANNKPQNPKK